MLSDRIIVMATNPGRISESIDVKLSDSVRKTNFRDIELTDEFNEIFLKVRESLQRISLFEMSTGFKDV